MKNLGHTVGMTHNFADCALTRPSHHCAQIDLADSRCLFPADPARWAAQAGDADHHRRDTVDVGPHRCERKLP